MFKQILDNYVFNKICRLFLEKNWQHKLLGFVIQYVFQIFMIFFLHKIQSNI